MTAPAFPPVTEPRLAMPNARLPAPKASVVMITYNHAPVIRQSLDSVLGQQTTFPFEVVIGDDCSTDGTREIVRSYQARHPDVLFPLLPERNLGLMGKNNYLQTYASARGEYVALLEGDDFWTTPHKLQKQVDALDAHPECGGCYGNTRLVTGVEAVGEALVFPSDWPERTDLAWMLDHHFPHTSSVMFRRRLLPEYPPWYFDMPMGDWPTFVITSKEGPYLYLPETLSAYRKHAGGAWTTKSLVERTLGEIAAFRAFDVFLGGRHRDLIARHLNTRELWLAEGYAQLGKPADARAHLRAHFRGDAFWRPRSATWRKRLHILLEVYAPRLRRLARRLRRGNAPLVP